MSATDRPAADLSFPRTQSGCTAAFGAVLLVVTGILCWLWYADRRERVRNSESWRREAERVTDVYAAVAREARAESAGTGDPVAGNHRKMAGLLRDNPLGREAAAPRAWPYALTLAVYTAFGLALLVLGLRGLRQTAPGAVPRPAPPA